MLSFGEFDTVFQDLAKANPGFPCQSLQAEIADD